MDIKSYENYLAAVIDLVRKDLGKEPWYKGVNSDSVKNSFEFGYSEEKAAEIACDETIYHDAPFEYVYIKKVDNNTGV